MEQIVTIRGEDLIQALIDGKIPFECFTDFCANLKEDESDHIERIRLCLGDDIDITIGTDEETEE